MDMWVEQVFFLEEVAYFQLSLQFVWVCVLMKEVTTNIVYFVCAYM